MNPFVEYSSRQAISDVDINSGVACQSYCG